MSDRIQLEKGEARMQRMTYHHQSLKYGKTQASNWLTARLQMLEKHYGKGFEARCRGYMRLIEDNEMGEM